MKKTDGSGGGRMKRGQLLLLGAVLLLLLGGCIGDTAEITPVPPSLPPLPPRTEAPVLTPEPTPTPEETLPPEDDVPRNPLTGLPIGEEWLSRRPVAIMLNNLKQALPQQGQSQADIIYECLEEGGITRMMGVYQSLDGVGVIGSIRSARTYYLEMALGHDAIFIHAGGSDEAATEDAYGKIRAWGVTSLDGVRGPYMSTTEGAGLMWRDPTRRRVNGSVHSVVTTGEKLKETLPTLSIRQEHEEGWQYEMAFADDGTPQGGEAAQVITVPFSSYKTGVFRYDAESGLYLAEEYGEAYIDGNTGEQVGVTNVVILRADCKNTGDSYGHIKVNLSGSGTGYFACGGKWIDLTWEKESPSGQFYYKDESGEPIVFGRGRTYVCIVPTESAVVFE